MSAMGIYDHPPLTEDGRGFTCACCGRRIGPGDRATVNFETDSAGRRTGRLLRSHRALDAPQRRQA
jgi:hypothetical protein